jgi:hypothetical protein
MYLPPPLATRGQSWDKNVSNRLVDGMISDCHKEKQLQCDPSALILVKVMDAANMIQMAQVSLL